MNLVERVLSERHEELGLAAVGLPRRVQTALLTPRFPASRHVVAMIFRPGDPRPRAVAKLPRRPGDNGSVLREAAVLSSLTALTGGPPAGVPALLGTVDVGGRTLLVETAVDGMELDPQQVRRNPTGAVRAGTAFIDALPVVLAAEDNSGWYEAAFTRPLDAMAQHVPLEGRTARLVARTHAVLEPLRGLSLPAVFEHGDLSHPNLFLGSGGNLQVIDWELATPAGLPGHDLVFFLQYISESNRSATVRAQQRAAFDQDVAAPTGWARSVLAGHLERRGVPAGLLEPLVVGSWARTAAGLVTRLVPPDADADAVTAGTPAAEGLAAALRESREFDLWNHALTRAE
jgi:hypothetical protein